MDLKRGPALLRPNGIRQGLLAAYENPYILSSHACGGAVVRSTTEGASERLSAQEGNRGRLYRMRTRMTAGMPESFSRRVPSVVPVTSSMV